MNSPRLLEDIRHQPRSLQAVLDHHNFSGRAGMVQVASQVRTAASVIITGMGASLNAATPFYYSLAVAGIRASLIETAELLHYQQAMCRGALVVIVSRSGESVEAVKLQHALRAANATVVAVTNDAASELARGAASHLLIGSLSDEIVAIQSYTGTVLALQLLAAEILGCFHAVAGAVFTANSQLPEWIDWYERESLSWQSFLQAGVPVYALGRGASVASAQETALLFGETAKLPALAMPAATFRHGPVEVVDSRFRAILFASAGRTRDLNLALARELSRLGGEVRIVGPPETASELPFWRTADYPESLAPVFEIVPAQFAALRLAEWSGIRPGVFRNTGQVTRDEVMF